MQNLQLPSGLPRNGSKTVLGLMSGTSLDGLDLALCNFTWDSQVTFKVIATSTIEYSDEVRELLRVSEGMDAVSIAHLDVTLGRWFAGKVKDFIALNPNHIPDMISSHGHTIFHQPNRGLTLQIGSGAILSAETGIPVICDFRSQDVALGGQGAPLVPQGDKDLFSGYDACVNLGGFANISMESKGKRIAWDVCPVNVVLNEWAKELGLPYDPGGMHASKGSVQTEMLESLNQLTYYQTASPKSLGMEWVKEQMYPQFKSFASLPITDKLRTYSEHIAIQLANSLRSVKGEVLFTGGGVWNNFLMGLVRQKSDCQVVIRDAEIVNFKEAIIFAYLGLLRWYNCTNVLASVTGAAYDHVAGCIYNPQK